MKSALHSAWRLLPHNLRRVGFDAAALQLGRLAAASGDATARGPVTVAAAFYAPTGLGEAARTLLLGLMQAGYPTRAIDLTGPLMQERVVAMPALPGPPEDGPGVLIVVQPAPVISFALWRIGRRTLAGKRIIGHLVWEYGVTPRNWHSHVRSLHGILAPSRFCQRTFQSQFGREVGLLPYPLALQHTMREPRRRNASGPFRIGFVGDLIAAAGRKNPLACVAAVSRAFGSDPGVELTMTLGGGSADNPTRRATERAAREAGIRLVVDDRYLDENSHRSRFEACDAYLSLHKAEGFGMTVAEAILAGVPSIVTSAPPMDELGEADDLHLLPFRFDPVPASEKAGPGAQWAMADIDAAAERLRWVRANPDAARAMAARAAERLARMLGPDAFSAAAHVALGPPTGPDERALSYADVPARGTVGA